MKIGTITIETVRQATEHYECAAWHRSYDLAPGTSDLSLTLNPECWPQFVCFGQEGTVTSSCFDSLYCGQILRPHRNEDVGQKHRHATQLYAYQLAEQTIGKVELLPEWQWLMLPCEEWRNHVNRFRFLRLLKSENLALSSPKLLEESPDSFEVAVGTKDGTASTTFRFKIDEKYIVTAITADASMGIRLGDLRERDMWSGVRSIVEYVRQFAAA